jgi:GTP pyrophosphokinase
MPILSPRFDVALSFASRLHAGQTRKGTPVPYVSHLLGVASLVLEYGGGEDEAIAALLHDAIEDQGGAATREVIRRLFGEAVVSIVDGCTDAETSPKPPWRERKEKYLAHLPQAAPSVLLVSAADKLYNARSILADLRLLGPQLWTRFTGGREGTLWYYRSLVRAYRTGDVGPGSRLVEELDRVVKEIEALAAREEGRSEKEKVSSEQ